MLEAIGNLWDYDPLLVLALIAVVGIGIHVFLQQVRMNALRDAYRDMNGGYSKFGQGDVQQREGAGCAGLLLLLLLVGAVLLILIASG